MSMRLALVAAITLTGAAPAFAQTTNTARDPNVNSISGFNVVLVVGETERGRSSTENLPEAAARALKDMGEFLPYKSYRVLDAQWTSCCGHKPTTTVSGRLQGTIDIPGPDGKPVLVSRAYGFSISASMSTLNIPMRFVLITEDTSRRRAYQESERDIERERQDVQAEIETLNVQLREMQKRVEAGLVPAIELRPLRDRLASMERRLADLATDQQSAAHGGREVIDSSFTMNAGETIVVGTSKLGGDKALIAVVTAVRKK